MLLSKEQWVDHPTEDVRFLLRGLSWCELEQARSIAAATNRDVIKDLGAEFVSALGSADQDTSERALERLEEQRYALSSFDVGELLTTGIKEWTYTDDDGPIPLDEETIKKLDEATAMFLVEKIVEITKPPQGRTQAAAPESLSVS
jgi:hypothetical protein